MHINLSNYNSLVTHFIYQLRDLEVQRDRLRFRRNLERLGEIFAYEISKKLVYKTIVARTSLGEADCKVIDSLPILTTILRAGLPLHNGLLNYFDMADSSFVSAYRKHSSQGKFEIELEYCSCPSLEGQVLILSDPMLATGSSVVATLKKLKEFGSPSETHVVAAIASNHGVERIASYDNKINIWTGVCDKELDQRAYIVPGLGDAGDLSFGEKLQN